MEQLYCDEPECDRPVAGHGRGKCQSHLKQLQRTGKTSPIAEKLSPEERVLAATNAWIDSDGDDEYEVRRRAVIAAAKNLGKKEAREAIRKALEAARARGVRLGRPPKVTSAEVQRVFELLRSATLVSKVLGVSRFTVWRIVSKIRISKQLPPLPSGPRPRG